MNINPDIFTINLAITTPAVPAPVFEFPRTPDKIMFLIYFGLADLPSSEFHDIIDKYQAGSPDFTFRIAAPEPDEQSFVMAFESETAAMEFISYTRESLKPYRYGNSVKLAVHAGTVSVEVNNLKGQSIEELKEIGCHVGAGLVCASEQFAASLALNNKSYHLHHAGVINSRFRINWPFYNVEFFK